MLEHKPVYTLGRGACKEHLLCDPRELGIELLQVERGGEVTYHGPGQLVCYPILNLNRHKRDLHWYRRQVEEVVIRTLAGMGLHGGRGAAAIVPLRQRRVSDGGPCDMQGREWADTQEYGCRAGRWPRWACLCRGG